MTVGFLGAIREITGTRFQSMRASTVKDLLHRLLARHGKLWGSRVFDGQELASGVVIMVNGTNILQIQGLSTPLGPEDRVDIFPMFEGG